MRKLIALAIVLVALSYWYGNLATSLIKPNLPAAEARAENLNELPDNSLSYPNLGIRAPIFLSAEIDPLRFSDWSKIRETLRQGVQLTFESPTFAEAPLIFAIGHSFDTTPHRYSAIFAGLGQAKIGQTVFFKINGQVYTYRVVSTQILDPLNERAFRNLVSQDPTVQRLAMVTCWPPTTIDNRLVVLAERSLMTEVVSQPQ